MKADRIMALVALATLTIFLGVLFFRVSRVDLGIVLLIGLGLVVWDLGTQLGRRRR